MAICKNCIFEYQFDRSIFMSDKFKGAVSVAKSGVRDAKFAHP